MNVDEKVRQLALELRWLPYDQQMREVKRLPAAAQQALARCWLYRA